MTQQLPALTPEEVRVLGCLIEKSQATPEYYPMTLNALVTACNQKTSREPVVAYDEITVEDALTDLRSKGLVAFASGTGRSLKYMHRAGQNGLGLSPAQATVMSIIMLRGPQTAAEVKAKSGRQFNFPSSEAVQHSINSLIEKETPFLEEAPRMVGQKEVRYRHLFYTYEEGEEGADEAPESHRTLRKEIEGLKETIHFMQKDITYLRNILTAIQGDVMGMQEDLYDDDMAGMS
ncbi:YceH family protein [bacterium]|nr:YceH family protein [bacterium]